MLAASAKRGTEVALVMAAFVSLSDSAHEQQFALKSGMLNWLQPCLWLSQENICPEVSLC